LAVATPGIHHVHGILYHRRSVREDVPYPSVEPIRGDPGAVATFLARRESGASVVEEDAICRVLWPLPSPAPKVSVVIPVRDRAALLRSCVDGLLHATDYPDFELLIVDNGSVETETLELLRALDQLDQVQVITHAGPFNFSAINNQAVLRASGSLVLLLNNDIEVLEPGWMGELVSQACRAGVGAVGALLLYPDRTIQHAGVVLGLHGVAGHPYAGRPAGYAGQAGRLRSVQSLSAVTAACLMVRKSLYLEVGGLDEQLPVAFNDVDFCLRLGQRGLRTVWTPHARLCHHESASRGRDIETRQQERLQGEIARFRDRWGALLDRDPAYHPALSLDGEAFCVSLSRRQYDAAPSRGFDPIARSNAKDATRQ
jgi:GT2 family glycosyltransferase